MPAMTNGEPPRIAIPRTGSKPLLVVADDEGEPVLALPHYLAWHKATGTYYVGGTHPRQYLRTTDRLQAIFRFREWVRKQGTDTVAITRPVGPPEDFDPAEFLDAIRPVSCVEDGPEGSKAVTHLRSVDFWRTVRGIVLSDPETFRRETGLRVVDERPEPSVPVSNLLDAYLARRKRPSEEETKKVKRYWSFFTDHVAPAKVIRDVDAEALGRWENAAYAKYESGGSPKTLKHHFEYVARVVNYAIKKQIDRRESERIKAEITSMMVELPDLHNPNPQPISVDAFHALLDVADDKWRAMLLTALNLCYYGCDVRRLPKSAIDFNQGWVIFDREKTGQTTRVGPLWPRTTSALKAYLKSSGHDGETVFITQYGGPYTAQGQRA